MTVRIYTIGFTRSTAEGFFGRLRHAGVRTVLDVRRNNRSQLAGFAKHEDLPFFLRELAQAGYEHLPDLAPTQQMLDDYRKRKGSWDAFAAAYAARLRELRPEERLSPDRFDGACLLCSEATPHRCHRRLLAEHLARHWPGTTLVHL